MSGRRQKDASPESIEFLKDAGSTRPRVILGDVAQTLRAVSWPVLLSVVVKVTS